MTDLQTEATARGLEAIGMLESGRQATIQIARSTDRWRFDVTVCPLEGCDFDDRAYEIELSRSVREADTLSQKLNMSVDMDSDLLEALQQAAAMINGEVRDVSQDISIPQETSMSANLSL